jgi:predicted SAM-dependent methyltransferase
MDQRKIKLNLGCGIVYKPGYLNIDKFNNSVADKICDADDLPFKSNSIDTIEAHHLIEHFDYIHCKYVLSEWFRVLKPTGIIIIETPDLEETFKKFKHSNLENKKTTLQWIYGIDSPGMQHKTGFDWKLIKNLLSEIGFENIKREKPRKHLYEPGMRIVCQKPKNFLDKQLFACFRKRLKKELEISDSYLLLPLENWVGTIFDIYTKEFRRNKESCLNKIISKSSVCNPIIPKIFLEECVNCGLIEKDKINNDLLNYLTEIEFHKKLFSLWIKRKKTIEENIGEIFKNFIEDLESIIIQCLIDKNLDYKEKLSYIDSLNPVDIKIFDFQVIQLKARELFNQGIKQFCKGNFLEALDLFSESVKINPANPLSYWNMARLKVILNFGVEKIENEYKKSLFLTSDKNIKKEIEREVNNVLNKRSNLVPKIPVSEDYKENIL